MMFLVEKTFKDKETKKLHEKGRVYESDKERRIEELKKGGFLGTELAEKKDNQAEKATEKQVKENKKGAE
jgi:hypothetical protein